LITTSQDSKKVKIIKRYQNRKLYDTQQSCYVTLDDIAKMIRADEEVMVIDNKTKNDITAATLTQIIFESEKKASQYAPLFTLREIIQHANGSISSYLAKLGAFPKEYIVKAAQPSTSKSSQQESVIDKAAQSYDTVKQSIENRIAQAATQESTSGYTTLPVPEETPSLPNPNNKF
jgi:polyhydroxyalkanoate synthesis repressor PhaR